MVTATVSIGRIRRRLEPAFSGLCLGVRPVQRGLLRASLLGLLRDPSPFVADVARAAGEEFGPTFEARERRLLRFLGSPKLDFESLKAGHRYVLTRALPTRGRVFVYGDLSDLSKPHARYMEGLDRVRDGSDPDKRIQPGYWLNEVYLELGPGRLAPVVFELYSLRSGRTLSQTEVLLRGIEEAFAVTGRRGVFVADRGYDDGHIYRPLLLARRDFVIRLQVSDSSRLLLVPGEHRATVEALLPLTATPHMLYDGLEIRTPGQFGWRRVRLPDHPDRDLTLVVVRMKGHPEAMALLTSLPVRTAKDARAVIAAYFRRWGGAEDPIRFVKQTFRLEKFLVAGLQAMRTWVFLIGVTMALLTLLLDSKSVGHRLIRTFESFTDEAFFAYYRLARALSAFLVAIPRARFQSWVLASGP